MYTSYKPFVQFGIPQSIKSKWSQKINFDLDPCLYWKEAGYESRNVLLYASGQETVSFNLGTFLLGYECKDGIKEYFYEDLSV